MKDTGGGHGASKKPSGHMAKVAALAHGRVDSGTDRSHVSRRPTSPGANTSTGGSARGGTFHPGRKGPLER